MGKLIFDEEELRRHLIDVSKEMPEDQLGAYYTNVCIKKYTPEEHDAHFQEVCNTILNVRGGYWQIVDNMDYMPEFEHYKMKGMLSYTKGNVPKTIAAKELIIKQYQKLFEEETKDL